MIACNDQTNFCYKFNHINFPFMIGIFASEVNKMSTHDEMLKNVVLLS